MCRHSKTEHTFSCPLVELYHVLYLSQLLLRRMGIHDWFQSIKIHSLVRWESPASPQWGMLSCPSPNAWTESGFWLTRSHSWITWQRDEHCDWLTTWVVRYLYSSLTPSRPGVRGTMTAEIPKGVATPLVPVESHMTKKEATGLRSHGQGPPVVSWGSRARQVLNIIPTAAHRHWALSAYQALVSWKHPVWSHMQIRSCHQAA